MPRVAQGGHSAPLLSQAALLGVRDKTHLSLSWTGGRMAQEAHSPLNSAERGEDLTCRNVPWPAQGLGCPAPASSTGTQNKAQQKGHFPHGHWNPVLNHSPDLITLPLHTCKPAALNCDFMRWVKCQQY